MKTATVIGESHDKRKAPPKVSQDKNPGRISRERYKALSFGFFKSSALERDK